MPAQRPNLRSNRTATGQGLVEFALVFPLLVAVFFAILEFGFYMMTNLTLQNATREGARMASTLIDLQDDDSRVITFVDGLIPDAGPFSGFTAISNTGDVDCEVNTLITVTIEGDYNFVALNFLGLNGIHLEYPATTHYELCGIFPVSDTAVPTAATLTPSNTVSGPTGTSSPTPTRTPTPSHSPTATRTPTGATATSTRTPTATSGNIEAPVWVGGTYNRSGSSCNNISLTWDANNDWANNPGFGPTTYTRYRNGVSQGTQSANYPNNVTWNTGTSLSSGQSVVFEFVANFSGGLTSMPLWKAWTCSNGSMIAQNTPTPTLAATDTRTPTPSRTPTASNTPSPTRTSTPSQTFTATWTPSRTPTASRTPTPSRTPTRTNTPVPPAAPVPVGVDWNRSGTSCTSIEATWDANSSAWSSYPGFGNSQYERFRNGVSAGTVSANYPNDVTWFTGDTLNHNQSRIYSIIAIWSNGLESLPLSATLTCVNGNIVAQVN